MSTPQRDKTVMPRVHEYLRNHPNENLFGQNVASSLGIDPSSVLSALARFANNPNYPQINRIARGVYRFTSDAHPVKMPPSLPHQVIKTVSRPMFEQVGKAKDGTLILESEDGTMYRATEL